MNAYPDTSFLCALYRLQANSPEAAAYDRVVEMRRALQRLGPTLVELKMLNP